eukprot:5389835-Karenia_brevis.AAC.1
MNVQRFLKQFKVADLEGHIDTFHVNIAQQGYDMLRIPVSMNFYPQHDSCQHVIMSSTQCYNFCLRLGINCENMSPSHYMFTHLHGPFAKLDGFACECDEYIKRILCAEEPVVLTCEDKDAS